MDDHPFHHTKPPPYTKMDVIIKTFVLIILTFKYVCPQTTGTTFAFSSVIILHLWSGSMIWSKNNWIRPDPQQPCSKDIIKFLLVWKIMHPSYPKFSCREKNTHCNPAVVHCNPAVYTVYSMFSMDPLLYTYRAGRAWKRLNSRKRRLLRQPMAIP